MSAAGNHPREERFEKLISILIASITVLAAISAFLQIYTDSKAGEADRQAQELSIRATETRVNGAIQFSYDWQGAFQVWREIDLQITAAEQEGDTAGAARLRSLRDQIAGLSLLLDPDYFDSETRWPNAPQYEADLYLVESTRLGEAFTAQAKLGNAWGGIADAFVIQLTLYAVALSLYGLSTTIQSEVRWLFVVVGSGMAVLNLVWMAILLIAPLPELPLAAIDAYAQGVGMAYQGKNEKAIAFFDQALSARPDYANALYERANAYYATSNYERATADYVAAQKAGRDDVNVGWNLGWTYYLMGKFDEAVLANQHTLALDSTVIGVRMNQGLALLALGKFQNARIEYDLALAEAARQVAEARAGGKEPPSSLWFYMDAGAADLESLLDLLNDNPKPWTQAPPPGTIRADVNQLWTIALEQIQRIKETTVALEYTGQPPAGPGPDVLAFQFGQDVYDAQGNFLRYDIAETFPYGTNKVLILFEYAGIKMGQQEIWKVRRNGFEDPSLRVVSEWAIDDLSGSSEAGSAVKQISYAYSNVFIFSPGEYTVELYIDSQLVQSGTFFIEEP
ncbi:MAG: tetratricopeptide repeat protein [Anaerolineales bacterium]